MKKCRGVALRRAAHRHTNGTCRAAQRSDARPSIGPLVEFPILLLFSVVLLGVTMEKPILLLRNSCARRGERTHTLFPMKARVSTCVLRATVRGTGNEG